MKWNELIFRAGAHFRNPDLFAIIEDLKYSDSFSKADLHDLQRERLSDLLAYFKEHSPYYKDLINLEADPFENLKQLPIIDKNFIIENIDQVNSYASCIKLLEVETSGTSGRAFKFKKNLMWDTRTRASWMRSYTWYNVQPWDKNGYFWGYNIQGKDKYKTYLLDKLQNRFRLFSYDEEAVRQFLNKLKTAVFLHGYSSMIYEVAKTAKKLGFKPSDFPKLKMIKGTSEKIHKHYQTVVYEVFGMKIISEYGAAETGIIAFECPHGNMHVNEENVIVEVVGGEAVITNLNAYSLPIIRYKVGDSIDLDTKTVCGCGRQTAIIHEIHGRVGKVIQGAQNTYPSLTLYYVFKNLALNHGVELQYQGVQSTKGEMKLKIDKKLSSQELEMLRKECVKYFGEDVKIDVVDNMQIHDKSGKLTDFKTTLNE